MDAPDFIPFSLNLGGNIIEYLRPLVMGVLNATPDSFYAHSRAMTSRAVADRVEAMVSQGVDIIDVGACSTRPGSVTVNADEEMRRLEEVLPVVREVAEATPISVDTFRAAVATRCVEELGAQIVNDVTGGKGDPAMVAAVSHLHVPYVLMHMRGTPATMQEHTQYTDPMAEVITELSHSFDALRLAGVADIIIDPGIGFPKTPEQGYEILRTLPTLREAFGCPVLIGLSRKSMLTSPLGVHPDDALPATVAANVIALLQGASILRVHDVAAARQAIEIVQHFRNTKQ